MLKVFKALVILTLLGVIGCGLYGAYFFLVELPKMQDAALMQTALQPGQPTPDPGKADFEKRSRSKRNASTRKPRSPSNPF